MPRGYRKLDSIRLDESARDSRLKFENTVVHKERGSPGVVRPGKDGQAEVIDGMIRSGEIKTTRVKRERRGSLIAVWERIRSLFRQ